MSETSPLDADRMVELVLALVALVFLTPGIALLLRPGRRLVGAALTAIGGVVATMLYVFATFRLPI